MEKNKNRSFFLYYASPIPHLPLQAPREWVDYYQKKLGPEEPYTGSSYFPNQTPRATYAAMISCLGQQVGELVAKLKEMGVYENTLIIFSSDNGPSYVGGVDAELFNMGIWKGIRKNIAEGNTEIELYNLEKDITEENNVAAENPEVVERIRNIMAAAHEPAALERFRMEALGDGQKE